MRRFDDDQCRGCANITKLKTDRGQNHSRQPIAGAYQDAAHGGTQQSRQDSGQENQDFEAEPQGCADNETDDRKRYHDSGRVFRGAMETSMWMIRPSY